MYFFYYYTKHIFPLFLLKCFCVFYQLPGRTEVWFVILIPVSELSLFWFMQSVSQIPAAGNINWNIIQSVQTLDRCGCWQMMPHKNIEVYSSTMDGGEKLFALTYCWSVLPMECSRSSVCIRVCHVPIVNTLGRLSEYNLLFHFSFLHKFGFFTC